MFDRHETHIHRGPSRVDVHEHRAPTDESVRLLREMETKARAQIIATIPLENNLFHGTVLVMERDFDHSQRAVAVFELNGARHQVEATVSMVEAKTQQHALLLKLHEETSRYVAGNILAQITPAGVLD